MCAYIRIDWVEFWPFNSNHRTRITTTSTSTTLLFNMLTACRIGSPFQHTIFWVYSSSLEFLSFLSQDVTKKINIYGIALLCGHIKFHMGLSRIRKPMVILQLSLQVYCISKEISVRKISLDSFLLRGKLSNWPSHIRFFIYYNVFSIIKIMEEMIDLTRFIMSYGRKIQMSPI